MEWPQQGQFNICFNLVGNGGGILEKVKLKKEKVYHKSNKWQPFYAVKLFWDILVKQKSKKM